MVSRKWLWLAAWVLLVAKGSVLAAVSKQEAERLKGELTPVGAVRAGNESGTIPPWSGGLTPENMPDTYVRKGQHHPDPYAKDKKLYTITALNMNHYDQILAPGLKALLKAYPETFSISVYPTRRSAAAPQWVYDNIYQNALSAELVNNGNGLEGAHGGVAFPIPLGFKGKVDPLMVLWNHITRWRGVYVVRRSSEAVVHENGSYSLATSQQEVDFVYYHKDENAQTLDNRLLNYISFIKQPARLAGGAVLIQDTIDRIKEPRVAWGFNAGTRKVRRAPQIGYEMPLASADGLITADDLDMFNGAPDRFEWHFLGKKEMLIPYNSYRLDSPDLTYEQMLKAGHIDPELARFELHRVWVVEARLKPGARHVYSKRTFYLDEDSWSIAIADQYDRDGNLWRVSLSYLKNYYEVPALWSALDVYHDLKSKRYYVAFLDNQEETTLEFSETPPPSKNFTPTALRRRSSR